MSSVVFLSLSNYYVEILLFIRNERVVKKERKKEFPRGLVLKIKKRDKGTKTGRMITLGRFRGNLQNTHTHGPALISKAGY